MEQQSSKRFFAHHQLQPSALHHHSTQHWLSDCPNEPSTPSLLIAVPPTSNVISSTPCETSCRSGSSMSHVHERDYISLAEISSSASIDQAEKVDVVDLHHEDTDLRLGLGPPTKVRESDSPCLESGLPCKGPPQTCVQIKDVMGTASISSHDAEIYLLSSAICSKRLEVIPIPTMGALAGSIAAMSSQRSLENTSGLNVCKYGTKRLFSDTISQVPPVGSCIDLHGTPGDTMLGGRSTSRSMVQAEGQPQYKHQQRVYWAAPQAWHTDSLSQVACRMPLMPNNSTSLNPLVSSQEHTNDSNALKGQVVGWPPVRSHRRNALATQSRPAGGFLQSAIYVKVNMDGIPIGRKVDLNAYTSYEELVNALEGMFQNPHTGARFLHAGEFALTYEDKEGDWMLVGDVPWGMFANTVRRLRITRASDPTCLGSSTS